MIKKTILRLLVCIFLISTIVSIGFLYYQTIVKSNYIRDFTQIEDVSQSEDATDPTSSSEAVLDVEEIAPSE